MPRGDGTGPQGAGPGTGRGMGRGYGWKRDGCKWELHMPILWNEGHTSTRCPLLSSYLSSMRYQNGKGMISQTKVKYFKSCDFGLMFNRWLLWSAE